MPDEMNLSSKSAAPNQSVGLVHSKVITKFENFLDEETRKGIYIFLRRPGWRFGSKSERIPRHTSIWHKRLAGEISSGHRSDSSDERFDRREELKQNASVLYDMWLVLEKTVLRGHRLSSCYANGMPYGCEELVHKDSISELHYTTIYFPHAHWSPHWGGEMIFFNQEETDILTAIYPKPNLLLTYRSAIPHVSRGVSRTCPALHLTLTFNTELNIPETRGELEV
jgi:SM-20-related protein